MHRTQHHNTVSRSCLGGLTRTRAAVGAHAYNTISGTRKSNALHTCVQDAARSRQRYCIKTHPSRQFGALLEQTQRTLLNKELDKVSAHVCICLHMSHMSAYVCMVLPSPQSQPLPLSDMHPMHPPASKTFRGALLPTAVLPIIAARIESPGTCHEPRSGCLPDTFKNRCLNKPFLTHVSDTTGQLLTRICVVLVLGFLRGGGGCLRLCTCLN